jgi:uncharacterized membrane protein
MEGHNENSKEKAMRVRSIPVRSATWFILVCLAVLHPVTIQSAGEPVVQASLFYSPNCSHCHHVITEVLVPMLDDYGDQLQIVGIDTSQTDGSQLYQATIERYQIPAERRGVPTLVVGDIVLVGSVEIPEQFPALVEEGLAAAGIDWPDIPGLAQLLTEVPPEPSPPSLPQATTRPLSTPTVMLQAPVTLYPSPTPAPAVALLKGREDEVQPTDEQDPPPDPLGFALAGAVLVGMVVAFGYSAWRVARPEARQRVFQLFSLDRPLVAHASRWLIPFLSLVGLGVASYLAYVEVTHVEAVCGPVGECNAVQTSAYALLLGVPVAVWGVLYYVAIAALWAGQRTLAGRLANLSLLGLLGLTFFGALFSVYLTCLELFVIHAICSWCLSSAVISTALMLLTMLAVTRTEEPSPRQATACARTRRRKG